MRLLGRWWNGVRSGSARRDIWLHHDGRQWYVRARDGGTAGRVLSWPPLCEEWAARALVDRLIARSPAGRDRWKDVIKLVSQQSASGPSTSATGPEDDGWSTRADPD